MNDHSESHRHTWSRHWDRWIGPGLVLLVLILWIETRFFAAEPVTEMPQKVVDEQERELYLTPGGRYTAADIAANGGVTASQRFAGFQAEHDPNPQPGDPICPITGTKAHPDCTWVIAGERRAFCCPPCIDEFIRRAKARRP